MRGLDFNTGWKFALSEPSTEKNKASAGEITNGHLLNMDDSSWRNVRIPHDWSREYAPSTEFEGCTGFLPGGMGWYRKKFVTTADMLGKKVFVNFDGIYNRATIYCNGEYITFHPFGYSPCLIEVSDFLNAEGEENVISVKVDHTRFADSRWYTGSGIYRKVSLHVLPEVNIPVWGAFFTTPEVSAEKAKIAGTVKVKNTTSVRKHIKVEFEVKNPAGEVVATNYRVELIYANTELDVNTEIYVENPELWELHDGKMYSVSTKLYVDDVEVQEEVTAIGIRYFHFDTNKGFFFNGKNTLIKGVCLHHDAGLVGAAVPKDVWRRRIQGLIDCGTNAIRTSHNPFAEDFFDVCDEMGMLVQEEFYDEWDNAKDKRFNGTEFPQNVNYYTRGHAEYFQKFAEFDLKNVVLRDRNHPSIFQWSIGNEIEWTYKKYNDATGYFSADASGGYFFNRPPYSPEEIRRRARLIPKDEYEVGETAHKLAKWTKEMDTTRPVIANCILPSASYESGYTDALDMVGYSYRRIMYDYGHEFYSDKPVMGTENVGQWHEWKAVLEREFVSGIFIWTGVDYMGEAGRRKGFPQKGTESGMLDFASFPKGSYYMYKSLWKEDVASIHVMTQTLEKSLYMYDENKTLVTKPTHKWDRILWVWQEVNPFWDYADGEDVVAEIYTNCDEVTLYVNGKAISTQYLKDNEDHIIKWALPYEAGEIKAVGKMGEQEVEYMIKTASEFAQIKLASDKDELAVDIDSAAHLIAQICDKDGNPIQTEEKHITFEMTGPYVNLGVDNGWKCNVQMFDASELDTRLGRAMIILQAEGKGEITVVAKADGIESNKVVIKA
ncbi:MAG: glycoside hydrolase family 2 TIM barrel-domain containing protein [Clostridia bacterium]